MGTVRRHYYMKPTTLWNYYHHQTSVLHYPNTDLTQLHARRPNEQTAITHCVDEMSNINASDHRFIMELQ